MNVLAERLSERTPAMAVVITGQEDNATVAEINRTGDVAEFRLDLRDTGIGRFLLPHMQEFTLPKLLTIRTEEEGGKWRGNEYARKELFRYLMPYVDGADVELRSGSLPYVRSLAHRMGNIVVASVHDFDATPPTGVIEAWREQSIKLGADYFKIAAKIRTEEDYDRLAVFAVEHRDDNVIVVGMEDEPRLDTRPDPRVEFVIIGSGLTYAHSGAGAVAPGQVHFLQLHEDLTSESRDYAGVLAA